MSDKAVDSEGMKLGLLMEAAQTHQELAEDCLKRLQAHAQGLDSVVRDEVRRTVIAELGELVEHCNSAAQGLKALGRAVQLRAVWSSAVLASLPALLIALFLWWWLPGPERITALRAQQQQLSETVAQLSKSGGRIDLRNCGSPARLCVRIDKHAPAFGSEADYLVVQGY